MSTYKKPIREKPISDNEEKDYHTLEKIDLSDIAQAIDGGRSFQDNNANQYVGNQGKEKSNLKKYWFW